MSRPGAIKLEALATRRSGPRRFGPYLARRSGSRRFGPYLARRSGPRRFGPYLALGALAALVSGGVSCTQSYYWGSYEDSVRGMCVKDKGYDSGRELKRLTREVHWAEAGRWMLVPPGKYMHVGYLHYLAGDAEAAKLYFLKEKEWFPESARFVDGMLERMK